MGESERVGRLKQVCFLYAWGGAHSVSLADTPFVSDCLGLFLFKGKNVPLNYQTFGKGIQIQLTRTDSMGMECIDLTQTSLLGDEIGFNWVNLGLT